MITTLILIAWVSIAKGQVFLQVSGSDLMYNGEKAFLSGMNLAWHNFGNDFGNGQYDCCTGAVLENYLAELSASGGNTLRVWLHCDGTSTPQFADSGEVISTDEQNTMVSDLQKFLDAAFSYDIFVILVLWNGATYPNQKVIDLMCDDSKLQSYLDNSLTPLVQGLSSKVALGAWEIMNEPEGMVYAGEANENDCYDTTILTDTGAGWVKAFVPMYNLQKFINRQAAHIKALDSKALVTVGSWSELSASDALGISRNYYTDECLTAAGGQSGGILDFHEMHCYAHNGMYNIYAPLEIHNSEYGLNKPNIIGEFSQDGGDGRDITTMIDHAYYNGYSGGWTWQANGSGEGSDDFDTQARAMQHVAGRNDQANGGQVDIDLV